MKKDPIYDKLQKDATIAHWLDVVVGSKTTRHSYLVAMKEYLEVVGKSPKELVSEARKELKKKFPSDYTCKVYIKKYENVLRSRNVKDITVKTRMNPIYSFYKHYDIIFNRDPIKGDMNPSNDDYPDKEMTRKALQYASPLMRALIFTALSSGLSTSDIVELKIKDFHSGYDPDLGITMFKLVRVKTKYKFITFLTPEATQAVNDYLEWRNRDPKQAINESSVYLFIKTAIPDIWTEEDRKLTRHNIEYYYKCLNVESGLDTGFGERNIFLPHQLRKFCNNQLVEAGINPDYREFFLGHKPPGSQANYHKFAQKLDVLKAEYIKAKPFLTIEKSLDVSESDDFKRIKEEHKTLLAEAERFRVERGEYLVLKEEIEKIKKAAEEERAEMRKKYNDIVRGYVDTFNNMTAKEIETEAKALAEECKIKGIDFTEEQIKDCIETSKGINPENFTPFVLENSVNASTIREAKAMKTLFEKL